MEKKPRIECKIERQKAKSEETAAEMSRQQANGEIWENIFAKTPLEETKLVKDDPLQESMLDFATAMGIPTEGNSLTDNFSRWGHTLSTYIFEKCDETPPQDAHEAAGSFVQPSQPIRPTLDQTPSGDEFSQRCAHGGWPLAVPSQGGLPHVVPATPLHQSEGGNMSRRGADGSESMSAKSSACLPRTAGQGPTEQPCETPQNKTRILGNTPAVKIVKLLRPKGGDLRELVLPGGGDLRLRVWAGMRRMMQSLIGWFRNGSTHTTAFKDHLRFIDDFLERKHHFHQHAWAMLNERETLRIHSEILFVLEDIMLLKEVNGSDVLTLLNAAVAKARKNGREKLAEQRAEYLAKCLIGGAGKAHKMANADNLLPPLRLVIKATNQEGKICFINDPLAVAKHYAAPWKKQWNADDESFDQRLGGHFQKLRKKYLNEAAESARLFDGSAAALRKALRMFPACTAIGPDDLNFRLLADLPDIALDQLGELFKSAINNLS